MYVCVGQYVCVQREGDGDRFNDDDIDERVFE